MKNILPASKTIILTILFTIFYRPSQAQVALTTPLVNGSVNGIVKFQNNLFICGGFFGVGTDANASTIAMLDAGTGVAQAWYPAPNGSVQSMIVQSGKLIVGGTFTHIAGQNRPGIAIFNASTGILDPMVPSGSIEVYALWSDSNTIYFAGPNDTMTTTSGVAHYDIVRRFDLQTGVLSTWHSDRIYSNSSLTSIGKLGGFVYAGGYDGLARFSTTTGALDTNFMRGAFSGGDWITQVLPYRNHIYVCGSFSHVGTATADGFMELDSAGHKTSFDISSSSTQNLCMFPDGNTLWVAGYAYSIGGQNNWYAGQIDLSNGWATCWTNVLFGSIGIVTTAIYVEGNTVYLGSIGGHFNNGFGIEVGGMGSSTPIPLSISGNTTVCPGTSATFSVSPAFSNADYMWYLNGGNVNGAYSSSVTLSNLSDNDTIQYWIHYYASCVPVVTLSPPVRISVPAISQSQVTAHFCQGHSYPFHGQNLTQPGVYIDTFTGYRGCDSIVTLTLNLDSVHHIQAAHTICPGSGYLFGGHNLTSAGVYIDTFTAVTGCDSIVTMTIDVSNVHISQTGPLCPGTDTLRLSGASLADRIQWKRNASVVANVTPDTVFRQSTVVAGSPQGYYGSTADRLFITEGMFVDNNGYLYVADAGNNRVQQFPPGSTAGTNAWTVAGGNGSGNAGNQLNYPFGIAKDSRGNLYVSDSYNSRVQNFGQNSYTGSFATTYAGGTQGSAANQLSYPAYICFDNRDHLYVADFGNFRIQEFPPYSNTSTNGTARSGYNGSGCVSVDGAYNIYTNIWNSNSVGGGDGAAEFLPGSNATTYPRYRSGWYGQWEGMCMDAHNNIFFTDIRSNSIFKYQGGGDSTTRPKFIAGPLSQPTGICFDGSGNMYVGTTTQVIKFFPSLDTVVNYYITPVSGSYTALVTFGGCTVSSDTVNININPIVHTYITDTICYGSVDSFHGQVLNYPGVYSATLTSMHGCDSIVTLTLNNYPWIGSYKYADICWGSTYTWGRHILSQPGLYYDTLMSAGRCDSINEFYLRWDSVFTSSTSHTICAGSSYTFGPRILTSEGIYIDTFSAQGGCDSIVTLHLFVDSISISLALSGTPCHSGIDTLTVSGSYSYPIVWQQNGQTVAIDSPTITIVAGGNGNGRGANQFSYPYGLCLDPAGNIYVADWDNSRIQKWAPGATSGTTVAGSAAGWRGDSANLLNGAAGLCLDGSGNMYIADYYNNRIQKWAPGANSGTTVAGDQGGLSGVSPTLLSHPSAVRLDNSGNMYIVDQGNNRIQKWTSGASYGTTVAGSAAGLAGNAANLLDAPWFLAIDNTGNLYISDGNNNRVQKWPPGALSGTTVVGDATGMSGVTASLLNDPEALLVDQTGALYIGDWYNYRVQKWTPGAAMCATVAGGHGYGSAINQVSDPMGVWIDNAGNLYIADGANYRVEKYSHYNNTFIPTAPGIYTARVTNGNGCNALSNPVVLLTSNFDIYDTICQGNSRQFKGHLYSQSGIYTDTLVGVAGCDSFVNLYLYVAIPVYQTFVDTICLGQSYHFGNGTYDSSGVYTHTIMRGNICDTVKILHLTVLTNIAPAAVIVVSPGPFANGMHTDTFTAIYSNCTNPYFSWFENMAPLGRHTATIVFSYLPSAHDSLLCRIDCNNRCSSIVSVYTNRAHTAMKEMPSFIKSVKVYPNPNQGSFNIELTANVEKEVQLSILNLIGQEIKAEPLSLLEGNNIKKINLDENVAAGIYILRLSTEEGSVYLRLVLER